MESWQKKGVDIVYTLADGQETKVTADIKMDRMIARTGNLFMETMSSEKVMGNMVTSEADFFIYLDPFNCKLYWIQRKKILDFWLKNQTSLPVKQVGNKDRITKGFLITTEAIVDMGLATVEDIYVEGARKNKIEATIEPLPF